MISFLSVFLLTFSLQHQVELTDSIYSIETSKDRLGHISNDLSKGYTVGSFKEKFFEEAEEPEIIKLLEALTFRRISIVEFHQRLSEISEQDNQKILDESGLVSVGLLEDLGDVEEEGVVAPEVQEQAQEERLPPAGIVFSGLDQFKKCLSLRIPRWRTTNQFDQDLLCLESLDESLSGFVRKVFLSLYEFRLQLGFLDGLRSLDKESIKPYLILASNVHHSRMSLYLFLHARRMLSEGTFKAEDLVPHFIQAWNRYKEGGFVTERTKAAFKENVCSSLKMTDDRLKAEFQKDFTDLWKACEL